MYLVILSTSINLRNLPLTQQKLTNTMCYMKKFPKHTHQIELCVAAYVGEQGSCEKKLCKLSNSLNFTSQYLKRNLFNGK